MTSALGIELGRVGFIGGGMMAEATIRGLIQAGVAPSNIIVSDTEPTRTEYLARELGVTVAESNATVARTSDVIVLAVKPYVVPQVLDEIGEASTEVQLVMSIAAGVTLASIEGSLPEETPVVRVMPNTPALIGEGASAMAPGKHAGREHIAIAQAIFASVGKTVVTTEDKMDAVTGLSGSGPAYVYTFIESLADGGVRMGLPRDTALLLAAQTVAGAARMVIETGAHPAQLRDRVSTPGGTTVAAMASLERDGFRSAVIEAVTAAALRSAELGKRK